MAEAQYNLGVIYKFGLGVPQDYAKALQWYRKAAAQGVAKAQFNLGLMYDNGLGVTQDYAEAVRWYRKAAEQGVAKAQFNLGLMYDNGLGVKQDYAKGAKWYRKAAFLDTVTTRTSTSHRKTSPGRQARAFGPCSLCRRGSGVGENGRLRPRKGSGHGAMEIGTD